MSDIPSTDTTTTMNGPIPCLLIPIARELLVLPATSVAEVLPYKKPHVTTTVKLPDTGYTHWFLGLVAWRGHKVPMISFEAINGGNVARINASSQMAILNSTGEHEKLPFLAFPTEGIPSLSRVFPNNIVEETTSSPSPYAEMQVKIDGIAATIPDICRLELAITALLKIS